MWRIFPWQLESLLQLCAYFHVSNELSGSFETGSNISQKQHKHFLPQTWAGRWHQTTTVHSQWRQGRKCGVKFFLLKLNEDVHAEDFKVGDLSKFQINFRYANLELWKFHGCRKLRLFVISYLWPFIFCPYLRIISLILSDVYYQSIFHLLYKQG